MFLITSIETKKQNQGAISTSALNDQVMSQSDFIVFCVYPSSTG